ncbi:ComEC/Rec2 family competence protein [Nocardioides daejeonensis]|uniref:ComEC/Rec2 family competence protein n=1 Tax=Nocardioides daejeonensis TaxID=1046556 RepID=UPI000D74984A|nr:ComEC/Rec2 family competence protein [Nocardioides daejeonensis]
MNGERDLRLPALAVAAWLGALLGLGVGSVDRLNALLAARPALTALLALPCGALVLWSARGRHWFVVGGLALFLAVGASALLREQAVADGAVARLAAARAGVEVELRIVGDPRRLQGGRGPERFGVPVRIDRLGSEGRVWQVRSPVLLLGEGEWGRAELGGRWRVRLRLAPSDDPELAALATPLGEPRLLGEPSPAWRAAAAVRAAVRTAVATAGHPERALVPALVDGDDGGLPEDLQADFKTTGLTHLLAVSGTNLTLVVGCLVLVGRRCGVRGRGHYAVAAAGIVGFILLARTEPSVVRAAAMGTAALLGLAYNGRDRGLRAVGLAVLGLLVWDPWLAITVGFALSALATAGILLLAPGWVTAMEVWLPRWAAQAVAVPLAAQLACTPVVAGISGQVSLVAVLANLLAAPLVAPATILGLLGGLLALVWAPAGQVVGRFAGWAAAGIIEVARRCAELRLPAIDWDTSTPALVGLTGLCLLIVALTGPLLTRPRLAMAVVLLLTGLLVVPLPTPGWPPPGWVLVACDVGQGDGLVLRAGPQAGVVVDAGPDPRSMRRCLDALGIEQVPILLLSHFHADHVDGVDGVLRGRTVGQVLVTARADPPEAARRVLHQVGARARVPAYGETLRAGEVTLQVIGPPPALLADGPNNASLVVLAEVAGTRILLTGDAEPVAQRALRRTLADLRVDVLKVPHHGSRYQELDLLLALRPRVAVISAGVDNDYGHPAPETLAALDAAGVVVLRTDRDGDVAVTRRDGELRTAR